METPNAQTLQRLYVEESKSLAEIGRLYGVHKNQVRRWLLRAAIPTRSVSEGTKLSGKYGIQSEAHREAVRRGAAKARAKITPEGRKRGGEKRRGQIAWNKGVPWTEETRAKHAYRQTPEYRQQSSERQRGERGNNWRGGATDEEKLRMQRWEWREARKRCYERDNYICQDCGVKCLGGRDAHRDPRRKIQAHHIIRRRDGGTDDLKNLVTLCSSCHLRREARYVGALFA